MPQSASAIPEADAQEGPVDDQQQGSVTDAPEGGDGQDVQSHVSQVDAGGTEATAVDPSQEEGGTVDLAEQVPAWRRHLEEAGLVDVNDVDEAAERAAQALRMRQERLDELQEQNRYYRQRMAELEQRGGGQVVQTQDQPAPQQEADAIGRIVDGWNDVPAHVIEQYVTTVRDEETGEIRRELSPNAPAEIRQQVEDTTNRIAQWHQVLGDPRKLIPALEARMQRMITEQLETGLTERERRTSEQTAVQSFVQENQSWLYELDPLTRQPLRDGENNLVYSRKGREFVRAFQVLEQEGVKSTARRLRYALIEVNAMDQQRNEQPQTRRADAQPTIDQRRRAMQARPNVNTQTPRGVNGVSPEAGAEEPGRRQKSYGQLAVELAKQDGLLLPQ